MSISRRVLVMGEKGNEPPHDKTNKMTCVPSEDSDQHGHLRCPHEENWAHNCLFSAQ